MSWTVWIGDRKSCRIKGLTLLEIYVGDAFEMMYSDVHKWRAKQNLVTFFEN